MASLEQALVENLHRQDLNALEEAAAYQQLMEDFGLTQEQVARRVGKSRSSVANHLRLFQLPPTVQKLLSEDRITLGHAKVLLSHARPRLPGEPGPEDRGRRPERPRGRGARSGARGARRTARGRPLTPGLAPGPLRQPGLLELEQLLSDKLSTKVRVDMGAKRGKLVVEFANLEDLERIYRIIN